VPSPQAAVAPKVRRAYVRPFLVAVATRGMWALLLMFVVGTIATEGGAWIASARFRHGLDELEGRTLAERRQEYENIRRWGTFDIGLRSLVDLPLRGRLVALADAVIADYRRDDPAMSSTDWRQANEALKWALTLSPGDPAILARQRMCEGHLARIAARAQRRGTDAARQGYLASIAQFEEAARLDAKSFDPYLGISSVQSYGLNEIDRAAEAIEEAERRGYVPGRRERALMGDGYLRRADRTRRRARQLDDEPERAELVKALADYERCVERFEPIQDFGRSRQNLQYCTAHRDRISAELDAAIENPVVM
jgi:hypothetical protein